MLLLSGLFAAIALCALWAYRGALSNQFVWDTLYYLSYARLWDGGIGIDEIVWMLRSTEVANWHPLTWASWALDYRIAGGLDPKIFHQTNLLLHAINSILVAWLALCVLRLNIPNVFAESEPTINEIVAATFVGALFALHPQHVESVAWVAQRKDLLSQVFALAAMLSYLRSARDGGPLDPKWLRWSLVFFGLGALSKPMVVTLPLVLLLLDFYPLNRLTLRGEGVLGQFGARVWEKSPFIIISAGLAFVTLLAQGQSGAISPVPLELKVFNAFHSISFYLHKFIWPVGLSPYYPYAVTTTPEMSWSQWLPVLKFIALTLAALAALWKGKRHWLAAWLFYLITLIPVLGIVQVGTQGAADRYAYFTTLPFYLLLSGGLLSLLNRFSSARKILLIVPVFALLLSLASATHQQVMIWNNALSLWTHAAKQYPESHYINTKLGIRLLSSGQFAAATDRFERAQRILKNPSANLAWLGLGYMHLGRYEEAVNVFIRLGINENRLGHIILDQECVQYNIGWNFAHMGMRAESMDLFSRVTQSDQLRPHAARWHQWLAENQDASMTVAVFEAERLPSFCAHPLPEFTPNPR